MAVVGGCEPDQHRNDGYVLPGCSTIFDETVFDYDTSQAAFPRDGVPHQGAETTTARDEETGEAKPIDDVRSTMKAESKQFVDISEPQQDSACTKQIIYCEGNGKTA